MFLNWDQTRCCRAKGDAAGIHFERPSRSPYREGKGGHFSSSKHWNDTSSRTSHTDKGIVHVGVRTKQTSCLKSSMVEQAPFSTAFALPAEGDGGTLRACTRESGPARRAKTIPFPAPQECYRPAGTAANGRSGHRRFPTETSGRHIRTAKTLRAENRTGALRPEDRQTDHSCLSGIPAVNRRSTPLPARSAETGTPPGPADGKARDFLARPVQILRGYTPYAVNHQIFGR